MSDKDIVEQVVKKKPRGKNIGETLAPVTEPGDNAKYIGVSMKLFNLSPIDLKQPEQVQARLGEYFQIHFDADLKPTVAGMAMCLGVDRRRLWEIKTGSLVGGQGKLNLPPETLDLIKKAYELLEMSMENYANAGKINPVMAIFMLKNHWGYTDKQEWVVTPNTNNASDYDADDIRKRYLTDSVVDVD